MSPRWLVSLTNEAKFDAIFAFGYFVNFYTSFFFSLPFEVSVGTYIVSLSRRTLPKERDPNKIFNLSF